jgi:glucose/arabinose dehydrogenase
MWESELVGTEAADQLNGTDGDDRLVGLGGDDVLRGGPGRDELDGGAGNDQLYGEQGNDTLLPGSGNDRVDASWGRDKVRYVSGNDTIFEKGGTDLVEFSGIAKSGATFARDGNDLVVTVAGKGTVTVDDHFASGGAMVESFVFSNGTIAAGDIVLGGGSGDGGGGSGGGGDGGSGDGGGGSGGGGGTIEPEGDLIGTYSTQKVDVRLEQLADLNTPWGMDFLPDGGILVSERGGVLREYDDGGLGAAISGMPSVLKKGRAGLFDVEVDPNHASNDYVYLAYDTNQGDPTASTMRIMRAKYDGSSLSAKQVIFEAETNMDTTFLYGGRMEFGGDGKLYLTIGTRSGAENDTVANAGAQDLGDHTGKIIRINTGGSVPSDNPFVNTPGAEPEVWSYGHRNAQGLALRPGTNQLWSNEHGPDKGDEINLIGKGNNYGWPEVSKGDYYNGNPIPDGPRSGMTEPVYWWDNTTIAPSGMTFVTGSPFSAWNGDMLVGGLLSETLVRLDMSGTEVVGEERMLTGTIGRIRDVATGPDGAIYLLTDESDGGLYRLAPAW